MTQKTMLFVFNPKAGKEEIRLNLFEVLDKFTKNGFLVTCYPTQKKRDAYDIVLEQGERYDYVVCSGGDGTLNETMDAMMRLPRRPLLGYIPTGSTNDYATTLGIPKDPLLAARTVCEGYPFPVDVGGFGQEHFSYVAAFGLFTDVSYDTPQDLKNLFGHAAYMLEGAKRLTGIRSTPCVVEINGEEIRENLVLGMVSNSSSIGGFKIPAVKDPLLDDGHFEVFLLKKIRRFSQLQEVIGVLLGNGKSCDSLLSYRAKSLRVWSDQEIKWTLDGEYGGNHKDVQIQNFRQAIQILVPRKTDLNPYLGIS